MKYLKAGIVLIFAFLSFSAFANSLNSQFKKAILKQDNKKLSKLLQNKSLSVNEILIKNKKHSPLAYAAAHSAFKSVRFLLKRNANLSGTYYYPALSWLVMKRRADHFSQKSYDVIALLLKKGANPNQKGKDKIYPLHLAAKNNDAKVFALLIKYKALKNLRDYQGKTAYDYALKNSNQKILSYYKKRYKKSAFKKADPYFKLQLAIQKGRVGHVKQILRASGYKARDLVRTLNPQSKFSLLHYAARAGHLGIARILLNNGADVNVKSPGSFSALHVALYSFHPKMALLLLDRGANPFLAQSKGSAKGYTPFHLAVLFNFRSVIKRMAEDERLLKQFNKFNNPYFLIGSFATFKILFNTPLKPPKPYIKWIEQKSNALNSAKLYSKILGYLEKKGFHKESFASSYQAKKEMREPYNLFSLRYLKRRKLAYFECLDLRYLKK